MKKILLLSALFLGMSALAEKSHADSGGWSTLIGGGNSHYYTTLTGTGTSIVSGRAGTLYGIFCSTGNGSDYAVAFDTGSTVGVTYAQLSAGQRIFPAVQFTSSTVQAGFPPYNGPKSDNGVRFREGLYLFKSASMSGEANVCTAEWSF